MATPLHEQRLEAVLTTIRERRAKSVLDLGCGDGEFLFHLLGEPYIERIVGLDVSRSNLERLRKRLSALPYEAQARVDLFCDSMTNPHAGLAEFDVAVMVESIEHIEPRLLSRLERTVFRDMQPVTVVITTPNSDFNPLLGISSGGFRHDDHRFEWGRAKFRSWAEGVASRSDYVVRCSDVGAIHPIYGGLSQLGVFDRNRRNTVRSVVIPRPQCDR